jgi:hypothetical protein
MPKTFFAACVALLLLACGGGGDPTQLASSESLVPSALRTTKGVSPHSSLVAGAVSVVNTATAGQQDFRGIGALADGGYAVGWSSGSANFVQRYDSFGMKSGSETFVPGTGTMAVLTTGDVVHACCGARFGPGDNAFLIGQPGHTAVTAARFDANGNFLQRIEVVSIDQSLNPSAPTFFMFFAEVKVVALADGGFVVGWILVSPGKVGISDTLFTQRYDSQGQAVGGSVQVAPRISTPDGTILYNLAADAQGGYTVTIVQPDFATPPTMSASVFHYDVNGTGTQIVAPRPGPVFVRPLEGDRYVLFTSDSSGTFRQLLDSDGNPAGDPSPIPAVPFDARELPGGSFVVFWNTDGNITAQSLDGTGTPLGDLLAIQTGGSVPGIAALADGGFALAWSAPSTAGDLDVFTQRFVEVVDNDHAALRAKRKACLESAKGLVGQARKTFMDACLG